MPNFDGSGPKGKGPLTGQGMGFCVVELNTDKLKDNKNIENKEDIMPRGDGTGPAGLGPMTGRAAGYCAGYPVSGYANPIPGRGRGFRFGGAYGRGRGWGRGLGWRAAGDSYAQGNLYPAASYLPAMTPQQETDLLKGQAKAMQEEINVINERIKELEISSKS